MSNSFKIANAINSINDDLILEADASTETKTGSQKPIYLKYAAAAAALVCVTGVAAAIAKTRTPSVFDSSNSTVQASENDLSGNAVIKMSDIHFNETFTGSAQSTDWDPSIFDSVLLNSEEIIEYFGWDLIPKYIPEGLLPNEKNSSTTIYSDKDDGRIVHDRTVIQFYDGYTEYGAPKCNEYRAPKGFELIAARYGSRDLCCRVDISNIAKTSSINGTDVYFARFSVPLGKVSNPSGYYNEYIAEFELDNVSYRVTASQLEASDIVKIVSSIICGEKFSVEE